MKSKNKIKDKFMESAGNINAVSNNTLPCLILDHIFIMVNKNAPEIQKLKDNGFFITDIINRHPGFGTSGRIIYFNNFYLELRWVEDRNVFMKGFLPLCKNKKELLTNIKTGIALYAKNYIDPVLPFKTNNYCWDWMNPGSCMKIAEIENELTPIYSFAPNYMAYNEDKIKRNLIKPLVNHENKIKNLSNVNIVFNGREMNNAEMYLSQLGLINYQSGNENYMVLEFDNNKKGKEINLIKELSIIIKY